MFVRSTTYSVRVVSAYPTYPSLATKKNMHCKADQMGTKEGWPYLNMSLDDTGLLYCKSFNIDVLTSIDPNTRSDILPLPSHESAIDAIASSVVQERQLRFGGRLNHVETSEAEFVAQLEHLRDFYMQPLLGQKPLRRSIRARVFSFDQLAALFQKGGSLSTSCNIRRTHSNGTDSTADSDSEREHVKPAGICSILKGLHRQSNACSEHKLDSKAIYHPTAQNERIVSASFDHLFKMIELHSSFLSALKEAHPVDLQPSRLAALFMEHIPHLHLHFAHANILAATLNSFETLAFNDEKLARTIKMRDQASLSENLRSLLISIPAARIWYYGSVLQTMYSRLSQSVNDPILEQLEWCLDNLESIARRMWPVLMKIGNVQRVALLQRNIVGIKESILSSSNQRIIYMDTIDNRTFNQSEEWQTSFAVLLSDRLLLLKETGRRKNRIVLKSSICLKDASLFPAQKILGKSVNGFFVRLSNSNCIQLRVSNEHAFNKWYQMFKITGSLRNFSSELNNI
ncbi:hypothetical protein BDF19DRAFT_443995 [Syncephalis fuscata]|nr:hypothetical protein BDF19DRAFT_443995 [Syncephalis fuscata]